MKEITNPVGAKMYRVSRYGIEGVQTIEKVGKLHATLNNGDKIRMPILEGKYFSIVGASSWNLSHYEVETPELIEKFQIQKLRNKAKKIIQDLNVNNLNKDQLNIIITQIESVIKIQR